MPQIQDQVGFNGGDVSGLDGATRSPNGGGVDNGAFAEMGMSHEIGQNSHTTRMGNGYHHLQADGMADPHTSNDQNGPATLADLCNTMNPAGHDSSIGNFNNNANPNFNGDGNGNGNGNSDMHPLPMLDSLETDWFQLLFGNTQDLVSQPPPAFPPLHFQPPPLPPPTQFYVPPDFLPKHSLHDSDDSHGGEFTRVLVRDDKRAEMMADPAFLAPYFPNLYVV
jgi:hypothetical protein